MSFVEELVVKQEEQVMQLAVGTLPEYDCKRLIVSGYAAETTVHTGGTATVDAVGFMGKTVLDGGTMNVYGQATETTILTGGKMTAYDGSQIQGVTVSKGGVVSLGGKVASLSDAGTAVVYGTGSVEECKVLDGGILSATDDSVVSGVILEKGAEMTVSDDAVAQNVAIANGASVNGITHIGESGDAYVDSVSKDGFGGYINNLEFAEGTLSVADGATLTNVTVAGDGQEDGVHGVLKMGYGAVANETLLLKQYGSGYIAEGASVENLSLEDNAYAEVGGTVGNVGIRTGGKLNVLENGTVSYVQMSLGNLKVCAGGTVSYITAEGGEIDVSEADATIEAMNLSKGVKLNGSIEILEDGATMTDFADNTVGGMMKDVAFTGTLSYNGTEGSNCLVENGGTLAVLGGTMESVTVAEGGTLHQTGGTIKDFYVDGGTCTAENAESTLSYATVKNGGKLTLTSVSEASYVDVRDATAILSSSCVTSMTLQNADIHFDGTGDDYVYSSGTFRQGSDYAMISYMDFKGLSGNVIDLLVTSGAATLLSNCVGYGISAGNCADGETAMVQVNSGAKVYSATVLSGGTITADQASIIGLRTENGGLLTCNSCTIANDYAIYLAGGRLELTDTTVTDGTYVYFEAWQQERDTAYIIDDLSLLGNAAFCIIVSEEMAAGNYYFAGNCTPTEFFCSLRTDTDTILADSFAVGDTVSYNGLEYTLCAAEDNGLYLNVTYSGPIPPTELVATPTSLTWKKVHGVESYTVEFSTDAFETMYTFTTTATSVSMYGISNGKYYWRAYSEGNSHYTRGPNLKVTQAVSTEAQHQIAVSDGVTDVFFAKAAGQYSAFSVANNALSGLSVNIGGKNRFKSVYTGSTDTCYLVLTDTAAGDAFFLEDTLSEYPEDTVGTPLRFTDVDEIYAGKGDDVVDLTTTEAVAGLESILVHGGEGNDTIWGNQYAQNTLLGDAGADAVCGGTLDDLIAGGDGNDVLYGGGGDDVFAFGENWGSDSVVQADSGSVTLWFETGDSSHWNPDTMTYSDGTNSVTVSGVTSDKVTLKFGEASQDSQYSTLVSVSVFNG